MSRFAKSLFFFVRRWTSAQRPRRAPPRGLAPPAPRASPLPAPARRDGVSPRRAVCRRGIARRGGARGRAGVRVPRVVRVSAGRDRPDARGGDSPDRRPRRRGVARGRRGGPGRQGLGGDAERRPGVAPKPSRVVGEAISGSSGSRRVPRRGRGSRPYNRRASGTHSETCRRTISPTWMTTHRQIRQIRRTIRQIRGVAFGLRGSTNRSLPNGRKTAVRQTRFARVRAGDSLVTGAGASDAARGFGPPLPRVFAEVLADATGRAVEWRAFGKKAADVKRHCEEGGAKARARRFLEEGKKPPKNLRM